MGLGHGHILPDTSCRTDAISRTPRQPIRSRQPSCDGKRPAEDDASRNQDPESERAINTNTITVKIAEGAELRAAFDDILAPSFPYDELEPFDLFASMVEDGRREVRIALDGDEMVAVAVTKELPGSGAVLISHHATKPDRRGAGYGSQLYRALLTSIVDELQPSLVLGEVAHPDYHEPHPQHGDPLARLRFYGRFDARIIDVPYFQASLGPGLQPVYGLLLLALYVRPDLIDPARSRLDNPENLLSALRTMLEWDGEPDDFSAARLLTAASQGRIQLVPLEQFRQVMPGLKR